jgi:hypothetical protein
VLGRAGRTGHHRIHLVADPELGDGRHLQSTQKRHRWDWLEVGMVGEHWSLPSDPVAPIPSFTIGDPAQAIPKDRNNGAKHLFSAAQGDAAHQEDPIRGMCENHVIRYLRRVADRAEPATARGGSGLPPCRVWHATFHPHGRTVTISGCGLGPESDDVRARATWFPSRAGTEGPLLSFQ